jgi:outer membrane cobalamin receptor
MALYGHTVVLRFPNMRKFRLLIQRRTVPLLTAALVFLPMRAMAAGESVETLTITASPLAGGTIMADAVSTSAQLLDYNDIERSGTNVLRALSDAGNGVSLSNAQGNPFQPNVVYRGFEGSPLAGDAQGLAVYVNGVRFNQAFGDTVNWDLLPDAAIDRLNIQGSNPVFGLNALGGSISVQTRTASPITARKPNSPQARSDFIGKHSSSAPNSTIAPSTSPPQN